MNKLIRERGVRTLLLGLVALGAQEYARWCYGGSLETATMIVYGLNDRPYVYRALVPWLARCLAALGMRADVALSTVVVLSAIGLVYAIQFFLTSFSKR